MIRNDLFSYMDMMALPFVVVESDQPSTTLDQHKGILESIWMEFIFVNPENLDVYDIFFENVLMLKYRFRHTIWYWITYI